jgi:very-short-patch-repair endonuclease
VPRVQLRDVLARQDLVVTRAQALTCGMSDEQWEWRLRSRRWTRVTPGVAVAHTGELTSRQRVWAACLHAGAGAVLTGDAALEQLGLARMTPRAVDVVVPHTRRLGQPPVLAGVPLRLRRSRRLEQLPRAPYPLPLVAAHAAVLHAAGWAADDQAAEWRVAAVVQQRLSAPVLIRQALAQLPRLPRRALLRTVLDDVELGAHAGSELQLLRFLRAHGLPRPDHLQLRVRVGRGTHYLDARYDRVRVTIEVDGAHHRDAGQWEADALRTLRLVAAMPGERVVRLTPGMLRHHADEVAALLALLLA